MTREKKYSVTGSFATTINWLSAALLLISYLAKNQAPSHHSFIAILGLFYPVLFFINLFFVFFWIWRKKAKFLVSLLVLIMGIPQFKTHFSFHFGRETKDTATIKVISYNVQGFSGNNHSRYRPELKGDILRFLIKAKPDILCLQEYSGSSKDLFTDNRSGKSSFFYRYYSQKGSKNTGLVTVTKGKIFHHGFLKFKGYRTFGIVTDMTLGKDTLRVVNLHLASISLNASDLDLLSSPPSTAWEKENIPGHYLEIYRKLQKAYRLRVKQLKPVIKSIQKSPWPVILCGDFNDTPSSWAYHRIAERLNDAFVKRGSGLSTTYAGPLPFLRIDYLFAGKPISIVSYRKYVRPYSDHFPVSMQIKTASP